jgi:RNA-directed DNA polymerase
MKSSELKTYLPKERAIDMLLNLELDLPIDESFYNKMILRKKNKRKRIIHEPVEPLKVAQRSLLRLLYNAVEINKKLKFTESKPIFKGMKEGLIRGVTAYRPFSSVIRNAHFHKNQEMLIKLDINNFFGSVREKHIKNLWRNIWSSLPRQKYHLENNFSAEVIHKLTKNSVHLSTLDDSLPQGAPTSGFLANCVLDEFDKILLTYCSKRKLNYSRYSDDITISGKSRKSNEISRIISFVSHQLKAHDFQLHERKTRVLKKNNRQIVTGVVVNEKLSVPRKLKKALRQEVYYLFKFADAHVNRHHSNLNKYLNRLIGKVNWVLQVEKSNSEFENYRTNLKEVKFSMEQKKFALGLACREVLDNSGIYVSD